MLYKTSGGGGGVCILLYCSCSASHLVIDGGKMQHVVKATPSLLLFDDLWTYSIDGLESNFGPVLCKYAAIRDSNRHLPSWTSPV